MLTSKFSLTLVLYITLALSLASSHASPNFHGNRLIKKRHPQGGIPAVIGAAADPGSSSGIGAQTSASSSPSSVIQPSTTTSAPPVASAPTTSPSAITTTSQPVTTSVASSSVTTSQTTSRTSSTLPTSLNISNLPSASYGSRGGTVFTTSTAAAASATSSAAPSSDTGKHTTITVLIVIAAAVGGVAVIWTVIRKWKFRPSSQFEDRMQPIDWQPTTNPEDGVVPGHRRMTSNSSSFLSGSHEHADNMAGRGISGGYGGGAADITPSAAPIPDHDFTAGPANLAPVGGYADLARGPSPQPQMQEALTRGPSINRLQQPYDHYGVPAQQQAYAQDAYDYNGGAEY